jgi:hypothetical protein
MELFWPILLADTDRSALPACHGSHRIGTQNHPSSHGQRLAQCHTGLVCGLIASQAQVDHGKIALLCGSQPERILAQRNIAVFDPQVHLRNADLIPQPSRLATWSAHC